MSPPRFRFLILAAVTVSLSIATAEELTVESVLESDPSDRISTVFRFSRNAELKDIKTLASNILLQWPERWEGDERRYLLPVFVRWAELDQTGLKKFVEINRLQRLGNLHQAAIRYIEPPKSFEERLAETFSEKVFQQWIDSDPGRARLWFEKNENRFPSAAKLVAISIAKKEGLDSSKKWADARKGVVSSQSALAGWLISNADEDPDSARELALKLPAGLARQEGLQAALMGIATKTPKKSLGYISQLGKESDSVTRKIIGEWARSDAEECFQFLTRTTKNGIYIDTFLDSLVDQGDTTEAVDFLRKWDLQRKSIPQTPPIASIERLTEILRISAPGLAAEMALLTEDEKSILPALQTLAMENPEKAIRLVKNRSGRELQVVAKILIVNRPDLAEIFLFTTHSETISLARSQVRFLVSEMLNKPDQAAEIFQSRMPDWGIAIDAQEGEHSYEIKESFQRICFEMASTNLLKAKTFLSLLPSGEYREFAGKIMARHARLEDILAIEPDPIMIDLIRKSSQFREGVEQVENVIYRDAIYAGIIDREIGAGGEYWNGTIGSVCDALAKIKTKMFRDKVLTETIVPALKKLGWSTEIEKEISESKLGDSEKSILRSNLNKAKKAPSRDPFADPFKQ